MKALQFFLAILIANPAGAQLADDCESRPTPVPENAIQAFNDLQLATFNSFAAPARMTAGSVHEKTNPNFQRIAQATLKSMQEHQALGKDMLQIENDKLSESKSTRDYVKDFREVCLDGDLDDRVVSNSFEETGHQVTFSCIEEGTPPQIRERLFRLTYKPAANGIEELADLEVLASDPVAAKQEFGFAEGAVTTFAISVAMKAGGAAAEKFFSKDEPDKPKHIGASAGLAVIGANLAYYMRDMTPLQASIAGSIFSGVLGSLKEAIDKGTGGHGSKGDLKANVIGIVIGAAISYIQLSVMDRYKTAKPAFKFPKVQRKFQL